jgi:hypothetical protein
MRWFKNILLASLFLSTVVVNAQTLISGFVSDATTGERLIGANITETGTTKGTVTDNNGYFTLFIKTPVSIHASYIGYASISILIASGKDTLIEISLTPGKELSAVVIRADKMMRPNVAKLTTLELQSIPSLGGKPDVMKALQLMPGIKSQSEGSSLLLVRGGSPGENMYLFDNVPVIYVNHLGGFMSVFNPDIINSIDVYKGGFPARYGGKLSSVVDITQKEGNSVDRKGSYSIGLTDLSLSLEGPIKKNASYIFTGRKTLFGILMMAATGIGDGNSFIMSYGFHDLNGKISWKPNAKNSLHFNIYQGDDNLNYRAKKSKENPANKNHLSYTWGNWLASANWKHVVSSKLFSDNIVSFTRYRLRERQKYSYQGDNGLENIEYKYLSTVQVIALQSAWKYQAMQKWAVDFGFKSSLAFNLPNYAYQSNMPSATEKDQIPTLETALYGDNKFDLPHGFQLNAGLRFVNFNTKGFTDFALEPRLSLNKELSENQQLNLSYMRVNQFSHLLFTPGALMSNEVWIPADKIIKPAASDQYSIGWTSRYGNGAYESEVSIYYKTLKNLATYKEGFINLKGDNNWRSKVETGGKGEAYGIEVLFRKNTGNWTGFAAYSWSKATRQYPGINNGIEFLYDYDRPNAVSLSVNHKFSERVSLNIAWMYQTGLPYTPVIGRQLTPSLEPDENGEYINYETFIYGKRNSARMKDYHRLDIGLILNKLKPDKKVISSWTFSVYNAYNRQNPVYYYYNTTATGEIINPETSGTAYKPFNMYQMSLFPIIPTVSYKKYFGVNSKSKGTKVPFKQKFNNWLYQEN